MGLFNIALRCQKGVLLHFFFPIENLMTVCVVCVVCLFVVVIKEKFHVLFLPWHIVGKVRKYINGISVEIIEYVGVCVPGGHCYCTAY